MEMLLPRVRQQFAIDYVEKMLVCTTEKVEENIH